MADRDREHGRHGAGRGATRPANEPEEAPLAAREGAVAHYARRARRRRLIEEQHARTLWVPWALMILGVWAMLSPIALRDAESAAPALPGGWLPIPARVAISEWNEIACGVLLVLAGWRSLEPHRPLARAVACAVGVWLSLAPVIFWAPNALAYGNDTLIGMLVIALTAVIPRVPERSMFSKRGGPFPAGWSYNPSSWPQRSVLIVLAVAGFLVTRQLALRELGYEAGGLEAGAQAWPISSAALAAFGFTLLILLGFAGGPARWRTMPWAVALTGALVLPLALVPIVALAVRPADGGAWCALCLAAAAIGLAMVPLAGDEVIATAQNVGRAVRRGQRLGRALLRPRSLEDGIDDSRTPELGDLPERLGAAARAAIWGTSAPWTLVLSIALGAATIAMPEVAAIADPASRAFRAGGALVVACAVIALGEPFRAARLANVIVAAGIAVGPFVLGGAPPAVRALGLALGALVALLAIPRGPKRERYGRWDAWIV